MFGNVQNNRPEINLFLKIFEMDKLKEMQKRIKKNKKTEIFKARLVKASSEFNTATFVVLQPGVVDRNGQQISQQEIVKASQEFMINLSQKAINFDHEENTDTQDAVFVENFILPIDMEIGITDFKKGTRLV